MSKENHISFKERSKHSTVRSFVICMLPAQSAADYLNDLVSSMYLSHPFNDTHLLITNTLAQVFVIGIVRESLELILHL